MQFWNVQIFHQGPFDPKNEHIIICVGYALSMNQTPFLIILEVYYG